jgi:hypothetical protein
VSRVVSERRSRSGSKVRLPGSVEGLTRAVAGVSGEVVCCIVAAMTAGGTCRDRRGALVLSRCWHRRPATNVNFVGSCEAGVACPAVSALACDQDQGCSQPRTPRTPGDGQTLSHHQCTSVRLQPAESVPLRTPDLRPSPRGPRLSAPSPRPHLISSLAVLGRCVAAASYLTDRHRPPAPKQWVSGTCPWNTHHRHSNPQAHPEAPLPTSQDYTCHCPSLAWLPRYVSIVCLAPTAGPTPGVALQAGQLPGRHPETSRGIAQIAIEKRALCAPD